MNDPQTTNDDWQDRLTDRVLAEAIGGEVPPDLSSEIAARAAEQQATPSRTLPSRRAWVTLLATAASLMLAFFLWPAQSSKEEWRTALREMESQQSDETLLGISSSSSRSATFDAASLDERLDRASKQTEYLALEREANGSTGTAPPRTDGVTAGDKPLLATAEESKLLGESYRGLRLEKAVDVDQVPPRPSGRLSQQRLNYDAAGAHPAAPPVRHTPSPEQIEFMRKQAEARSAMRQVGSTSQSMAERFRKSLRRGSLSTTPRDVGGAVYGNASPRHETFGFSTDRRWPEPTSHDRYSSIQENAFIKPVGEDALSTFSIDVDTASYSNVRQYLLNQRRLPPSDAVRVEELVNYFDYGYAGPDDDSEDPFAASMEVAPCPWEPEHRLVRIGIKGREVKADKRPLSNLVFLIDVSGSMNHRDKLPLVIAGLEALTDRLGENDRVAIVVYAGSEGVVLPSTSGEQKDVIRSALGRLQAGGSTAGGAGLKLAYEIAERNHIPGGANRVVLCTDGDFNVGLTGTEELAQLVETRAKETKVFLTVLGFGRGNLNDAMLETISGRGEGYYAYIDNEKEARRVLSRNLSGTLVTIAKDVKLQVEFNPAKAASYRLIGYENRVMAAKHFNDDTKDAGEIGAGHTVTALYEVVPVGVKEPTPSVDVLKYQATPVEEEAARVQLTLDADKAGEPLPVSTELLTLKIRYKQPEGEASKKLEFPLDSESESAARASEDFRWAAAVAEFGMRLRGSRYVGEGSLDGVLERARGAIGDDEGGYRAEFLDIVRQASELSGR